MKLSTRLENALKSSTMKMKVALGMGISHGTMINYIATPDKFLSDIGTTALIQETGIPESELFEFEIKIDFYYVSNGEQEKGDETHTIKAGSIQQAVNKAFEAHEDMSAKPFAAYYNNEKYTKTK